LVKGRKIYRWGDGMMGIAYLTPYAERKDGWEQKRARRRENKKKKNLAWIFSGRQGLRLVVDRRPSLRLKWPGEMFAIKLQLFIDNLL
jgi:hypothetical protein